MTNYQIQFVVDYFGYTSIPIDGVSLQVVNGQLVASGTSAGVSSLNALVGGLSLISSGGNVTITPSGSNISLDVTFPTTVVSLNSLTGMLSLTSTDSSISITPSGSNVDLSVAFPTVVDSMNALTGALSLVSTDGSVTITPTGTTIDLSAPASNLPDITDTAGVSVTFNNGVSVSTNNTILDDGAGNMALIAGGSGGSTVDTLGGTGSTSDCFGIMDGFPIVASASGTLQTIGINVAAGGTGNVRLALYDDLANAPHSLIVETASTATSASGWLDISVSSASIVLGTKYWLIIQCDNGTDTFEYAGTLPRNYFLTSYTSYPSTWSSSGAGTENGFNVRIAYISPTAQVGHLTIGSSVHTVSIAGTTYDTQFQTHFNGSGGNVINVGLGLHSDVSTDTPIMYSLRSRGTESAKTAVVNGDTLSAYAAVGYDGTTYQLGYLMQVSVNNTVSAGIVPCNAIFILADASGTPTTAMSLDPTTGVTAPQLHAGNGTATATFTTVDGKTVTVTDGIITSVV